MAVAQTDWRVSIQWRKVAHGSSKIRGQIHKAFTTLPLIEATHIQGEGSLELSWGGALKAWRMQAQYRWSHRHICLKIRNRKNCFNLECCTKDCWWKRVNVFCPHFAGPWHLGFVSKNNSRSRHSNRAQQAWGHYSWTLRAEVLLGLLMSMGSLLIPGNLGGGQWNDPFKSRQKDL